MVVTLGFSRRVFAPSEALVPNIVCLVGAAKQSISIQALFLSLSWRISWLPSNDNATRDTLTKETLVESSIAPHYISVDDFWSILRASQISWRKRKTDNRKRRINLYVSRKNLFQRFVFNVVVNLNLKTTSLRVLAINQSHFGCRRLSQHCQKHCSIHFGYSSAESSSTWLKLEQGTRLKISQNSLQS